MGFRSECRAAVLSHTYIGGTWHRLFKMPGLVCLNYHRIAGDVEYDDDVVSASIDELDWQASWLRERFRLIGCDEVLSLLAADTPAKTTAVCLTFDDGYLDNLQAAKMLMEKYTIPAIFFVPTSYIGSDILPYWDHISYVLKRTSLETLHIQATRSAGPWTVKPLDRIREARNLIDIYRSLPPEEQPQFLSSLEAAGGVDVKAVEHPRLFMNWDEVRMVQRMGHTVGAHTHTHPILANVDVDGQRDELKRSAEVLQEQLGESSDVMAYPSGQRHTFTEETQRIAKDSGFRAAFSYYGGENPWGRINPYDIRRVAVDSDLSRARFKLRTWGL